MHCDWAWACKWQRLPEMGCICEACCWATEAGNENNSHNTATMWHMIDRCGFHDFHGFSLTFIDVHGFSLIFNDFQ